MSERFDVVVVGARCAGSPLAALLASRGVRVAVVERATFPRQQAERQREAFPSARVELLEGLGHWPFLEDPAWVASLVVPFLREQLAAR